MDRRFRLSDLLGLGLITLFQYNGFSLLQFRLQIILAKYGKSDFLSSDFF
jgi:hypothetical protein